MLKLKLSQYRGLRDLRSIVDEAELRGETHVVVYCPYEEDINNLRKEMIDSDKVGVIKLGKEEMFVVKKVRIELLIPDVTI